MCLIGFCFLYLQNSTADEMEEEPKKSAKQRRGGEYTHAHTHLCCIWCLISVCVSTGSTSEDHEVMKASDEEEERKDGEDVTVSKEL